MNDFLHRGRPLVSEHRVADFFHRATTVDMSRLTAWQGSDILLTSPPIWDDPALSRLTAKLNEILLFHDGLTLTSLAEMGMEIRDSPVVFAPRGAFSDAELATGWASEVASLAAVMAVSYFAMVSNLTTRPFPNRSLSDTLGARDATVDSVAQFLLHELSSAERRPVAVILTPLSDVEDDAAQEELLVRARAVGEGLKLVDRNIQVIIPGENFPPSMSIEEPLDNVYAAERSILLNADVVVAVTRNYNSWGASLCVSWVEMLDTSVLVFKDDLGNLSRILNRGYFRTKILHHDTTEDDVNAAVDFFLENHAEILEHSRRTQRFQLRILPYVPRLFRALDRIATADATGITRERMASVRRNPLELRSFTAAELEAFSELLGADFDDLIATIVGQTSFKGGLNSSMLASLDEFVLAGDATATETVAMLQLLSDSFDTYEAFAASSDFGEIWPALLAEVRGSHRI